MDNNLLDASEESSSKQEQVIKLSFASDGKKNRREKQNLILICLILLIAICVLVYYYMGDPLHILGFTPPNAEQGVVREASPLGYVDSYVLPLGNADCVVFTANKQSCLMVDAGASEDYPVIDAFLQKQNIDALDVLVATHADDFHTGSMLSIMQSHQPHFFVCPAVYPENSLLAECVNYASNHEINVLKIGITPSDAGPTRIEWTDDTEILCLAPFADNYSNEDDFSIILRVRYGDTSMILSGDASSTSERIAVKMLPNRFFHSNIVLLGNHGKTGSSCEKYLSTVKASIAVASCDENGPDPDVISLVKKREMNLYRTDRSGTIHLRLDGINASVVE